MTLEKKVFLNGIKVESFLRSLVAGGDAELSVSENLRRHGKGIKVYVVQTPEIVVVSKGYRRGFVERYDCTIIGEEGNIREFEILIHEANQKKYQKRS